MAKQMKTEVVTANNVTFKRGKDKQIKIPETMSFEEVGRWAFKMADESEKTVSFRHVFETFPIDGAYALMVALKNTFGWTSLESSKQMFGEQPPVLIAVETSPGNYVKVPWGKMTIPGVSGYIETGALQDRPGFILTGQCRRKHEGIIDQLLASVKESLSNDSLYKGRAFKIDFSWTTEEGGFDLEKNAPTFLDTSNIKPNQLIFSEGVERRITDSVFSPIIHREACRVRGLAGKRGVLLAGPYGTGKTLTATVTAKIAEDNDTTFILLENVQHLALALEMARQYQPAVIFAEDVDRAVSGDRTVSMDQILNTIDGLESKDTEIMTILTTNHVDRINPAMLRPGRIDDVIEVTPPDAIAAAKLVRHYGGDLLNNDADYTAVGEALQGKIPAVISEVIKRAKLSAIKRLTPEQLASPERGEIEPQDLLDAAEAMEQHLELIKIKDEHPLEATARRYVKRNLGVDPFPANHANGHAGATH
tara:strand:+ start:641 stop:2074 length:1434 start_codon:yes stop_codon:yes gene_type:complete